MEKKGEPADPDPGDPGKSSESSNSGGVKSVELKNALPPATTITKESSAAGSKLSKSGGSSASSLSGVDPPPPTFFNPLVFIDLEKKTVLPTTPTCLTPSCQAQQQGPHLDLLIRVGIQGGPGGSRCRCLLFRRRRRPVHQLCGSEPDQGLATNSILFSVSFM